MGSRSPSDDELERLGANVLTVCVAMYAWIAMLVIAALLRVPS